VESKLGPLGTSAIYWPIVPAPGDCEDENLVEWMVGETEVLGENLSRRHFVHHKGKPATHRFSYGAAVHGDTYCVHRFLPQYKGCIVLDRSNTIAGTNLLGPLSVCSRFALTSCPVHRYSPWDGSFLQSRCPTKCLQRIHCCRGNSTL
jgi:hypothetical protein